MAKFLDYTGLSYFWSKLKALIDGKVSKSGDSMSGSLVIANKKAISTTDSTSFQYPLIYDNGTNMWVGAAKTAGQHHRGGTYISAGYNGSSGYSTIYVSVPNATNTNATNYGVYHTGNKPSKSDVGLGNVDNTSDLNKPISTATQTALDLKADITDTDIDSSVITLYESIGWTPPNA